MPQVPLAWHVLEAFVHPYVLLAPHEPSQIRTDDIQHVERRWHGLLRILVLADQLRALKLPSQQPLGRDAHRSGRAQSRPSGTRRRARGCRSTVPAR
eukprot:7342207-Prymnesium_polylepis.1